MASARAWATSETAMPCCAAFTSSTRICSLRLWVFDIPVRVHNARGVLEDGLDLLRNFGLAGEIGAIDLCDKCLDDRRPGGTSLT